MSTDRWGPTTEPAAAAVRALTWPCTEVWQRIDERTGRIELARTSWHETADDARAHAAARNAAWQAGTYTPEAGAYDYIAEGPPRSPSTRHQAREAITAIRASLRQRPTPPTDTEVF